jgi:hypothetical protein
VTAGPATVVLLVVLACWVTVAQCAVAAVAVHWARTRARAGSSYASPCPACGAAARRPCRRLDGEVMASPHSLRAAVAQGAVDVEPDAES